jgi:cytochrome c oxidase accessory protein FixG
MANLHQLRVIGEGSLGRDGKHKRPYPADVAGRFARARKVVFWALIALWAALPWIPIGNHPAVFLDVDKRQFFLFGLTFNAQDMWLLFFMLSGVAFGLLYATAVLGRVWCGWACPQTVFLEGVFRPIERLINGPRNVAMRRAKGPFNGDRIWRAVATHAAYAVAALLVAHVFLAYFVSLPQVFAMVRTKPSAHPEAFAWMIVTTGVFYGNFAFFREQLCVIVCPYGRMQSVLIDDDSLVVGYDERRGEPRGKLSKASAPATSPTSPTSAPTATSGDCIECNRCVVVCPTGIDIREGLQLDCLACTACIDACDDVMDKVGRPRGLIRYDSLRGLRGEARRFLRPRLLVYTGFLVVGAVVATFAFRQREPFEANIVRLPGAPYTRDGGMIRNAFELHVVNKQSSASSFDLEAAGGPDLTFIIGMTHVDIEPLGSRRIPVFVTMDQAHFEADRAFVIRVREGAAGDARVHTARAVFLGAP